MPHYLYLHSIIKAAEVLDLSSKDEVSKLCKGQEDDEEHDCESSQVLSTSSQCRGELSHGLVETDVLEHLKKGQL